MASGGSKNIRALGVFAAVAVGASLVLLAPAATASPDNDSFASRTDLGHRLPLFLTESNEGATQEDDDGLGREATGHSIWWQWTAPVSESITVSACESSFPTVVRVFTGTDLGKLHRIGVLEPTTGAGCVGGGGEYSFYAETGTTYDIGVDGDGFYAPGGHGGPLVEPPSGEGRVRLRIEPSP
jgi:hypothetical protein